MMNQGKRAQVVLVRGRTVGARAGRDRGGGGLIQRFQALVWPDKQPAYTKPAGADTQAFFDRLIKVFEGLYEIDVEGGPLFKGYPNMRFDSEAQELVDAFRAEIEARVRDPETEQYPSFIAHVSKYRSFMPTLSCIDHLTNGRDVREPIALDSAMRAADLCGFFESHARKIYREELRPEATAARLLAEKIRRGQAKDGQTVRDLLRHQWSGLKRVRDLEGALDVLEEAGWLRVCEVRSGPHGGAPSRVLRLHPDLGPKGASLG